MAFFERRRVQVAVPLVSEKDEGVHDKVTLGVPPPAPRVIVRLLLELSVTFFLVVEVILIL